MHEMNKWGSTRQFKDIVKQVTHSCNHYGITPPTLSFRGTIKLHGTNAAIGYDYETDEIWCQSRERIIKVGDDNAGFAAYVAQHENEFKEVLKSLAEEQDSTKSILFGEWAGGNIQNSNVAISQLSKSFYVFGAQTTAGIYTFVKDANGVEHTVLAWDDIYVDHVFDQHFKMPIEDTWNISSFPTYTVAIDFSNPSLIQNELVRLTSEVEARCPVAFTFNVDGMGEGIVWSCSNWHEPLSFKTKGEKHSNSKVKIVHELTVDELARIAAAGDLADFVCTSARFQQGISKLEEMGKPFNMTSMGDYLKWVMQDVDKEEGDIIEAAMIDRKQLMGKIAVKAKAYFITEFNKF